jgi:hypothetical protein
MACNLLKSANSLGIEGANEGLAYCEVEDRIFFSPSFLPDKKAGGLHIRRCRGLAVD